ncbi:MAG: PKD domain-containing protein [Candidatus Bathyarchaeia archaeon]
MNSAKKLRRSFAYLATLIATILLVNSFVTTVFAPTLRLNLYTNKQVYKVGDTIVITGNVTLDDSPITDAMVAIQVDSPENKPYVVRTTQTGAISITNWEVNITELYACDSQGNPKSTFTLDSLAYYKIKWKNYSNNPKSIVIAIYIEYSNRAPYKAYFPVNETIEAGLEESVITSFQIPANAPLGTTTIYANIFTREPKEDGYPYCLEKNATFIITSSGGGSGTSNPPTIFNSPNFGIEFSGVFAQPGTYYVYATTKYQGDQVSNSMTFGVVPQALPPVAYFTYYPSPAGVNMTLTFDASGSLALGYNDTIIRYEWRFGDGTPPVIVNGSYANPPNPKVIHVFTNVGTYIVTLNVTDNEGLWNTTSKQVEVFQIIPPTANFAWSPQLPWAGLAITFDGGISTLGWNGTGRPPIVSYYWNFGDTITQNVTSTTVHHTYATAGNYTVTLIVTDAGGQQDTEIKTVTVYPPPPQANGDVDGDGKVSMSDVVIVVSAFGSTPSKPNWDPRADIDQNGRVDMTDVMIVVSNFGKVLS